MRVGIDIDGVLADFVPAYQQLFVTITGRDLFLPGDNVDPPSWEWPKQRGYTPEETSQVWEAIKSGQGFWRRLQPMSANTKALAQAYRNLCDEHELYFITTRTGLKVKEQTEAWLINWVTGLDASQPTVLIAQYRKKGYLAIGLGLDCYIDDNYDNACDVLRESPKTRTYLLHRRYNAQGIVRDNVNYTNSGVESRRVRNVAEFLHSEGLVS